MSLRIFLIFLTISLPYIAQGLDCANNNPCGLDSFYSRKNGYQCIQMGALALCTCPNGGYEMDQPCRVCARVTPPQNPCGTAPNLRTCLETADFGTGYACLCAGPTGPILTILPNCDASVTLTSTAITLVPGGTTTISTTVSVATVSVITVPSTSCLNGGQFADNKCYCPSGFMEPNCEEKNDSQLCDRIVCQNSGVCGIRNPSGPYESICFCRYGTFGDYCQYNGTLGFCQSGLCSNNATCKENLITVTRHAYCECLPGYRGTKCETQYFFCSSIGFFRDDFLHEQGKYFQCKQASGVYQLERKSCPKGLRYDLAKSACVY